MIVATEPSLSWDPGPLKNRVNHSCTHLVGYPVCSGAGYGSEEHCLCDNLIDAYHEIAEHQAGIESRERRGEMCRDCLFHVEDGNDFHNRNEMAADAGPLYCHVMVPLCAVAGEVQRDAFSARDERRYPVCDGWRQANEKHKRMRKHLEIIK